jgi:Ca-activated chloride channel family protein
VLQRFVGRIKYDQVGLVVFGAQAFTQAPLTMDYEVLRNAIKETDLNTVDADGTAIGDGILTAVNRLAEYDGETNIVILATDGTNNKGNDPLAAAEIAAAKRVRIYIVGIGAQGGAPILVKDQFGVKQPYVVNGEPQRWEEPNDAILTQIAAKTGGEYFRATDEKALDRIYARIAELIKDEKKRREQQYKELFHYFLLAACLGLLLEMLIRQVWIREIA